MKLYYQDFSWAGGMCVVAESEDQARSLFEKYHSENPSYSYYEKDKPLESADINEVVDFIGIGTPYKRIKNPA
jgi:hypothetical protein